MSLVLIRRPLSQLLNHEVVVNEIDVSYLSKDDIEKETITEDGQKIHRLDMPIEPEIKEGDGFYEDLKNLAATPEIKTILEIGSSCGEGSTKALFNGIEKSAIDARLFCIESSIGRFNVLCKKYEAGSHVNECACSKYRHHYTLNMVNCYNVCSIPISQYMTADEVTGFYHNYKTNLNNYPLERVIGWLEEEIGYIQENHIPDDGIRAIMQENDISCFDLVLIDGSAFTAEEELRVVYGAKYIALDDIIDIKNWMNYQILSNDSDYKLLKENKNLRNGYAIFARK